MVTHNIDTLESYPGHYGTKTLHHCRNSWDTSAQNWKSEVFFSELSWVQSVSIPLQVHSYSKCSKCCTQTLQPISELSEIFACLSTPVVALPGSGANLSPKWKIFAVWGHIPILCTDEGEILKTVRAKALQNFFSIGARNQNPPFGCKTQKLPPE